MVVSEVSICNSALGKIGGGRIASLLEPSKEAQACAEVYEPLRDAVTQAHPWNFALRRAVLPLLADAPAFEFSHAFQLPPDCLQVVKVHDKSIYYRREGMTLLSNAGDLKCQYIRRIEDPSLFSPLYVQTLAFRIAAELAYSLSSNATLAETMLKAYAAQLREARGRNAQEGATLPAQADTWVNARW